MAFNFPFTYHFICLSQVWAYEHRVLERPSPAAPGEVVYPALARWGESTVSHDVGTHRARLNELVWDMVRSDFQPFLSLLLELTCPDVFCQIDEAWWLYPPETVPSILHTSFAKSGLRLLLAGVNQRLWYLGERVLRWGFGPSGRPVPAAPPRSMFFGQSLVGEKLAEALRGFPASDFTIDKPYQPWASAHLLGSLPLLELPLPSRVCGFFLV